MFYFISIEYILVESLVRPLSLINQYMDYNFFPNYNTVLDERTRRVRNIFIRFHIFRNFVDNLSLFHTRFFR